MKRANEVPELKAALAEAQARIATLEAERVSQRRTDPLTGAQTMVSFRETATRELERARRSGSPLALSLFEIDGLRALGAIHGPDGQDEAVRALTAVLREGSRSHDVIARTGSGELAVLLPECELPGALGAATRAVAALDTADVGGLGAVAVSAGVALLVRGMTLDALLAEATEHLLRARAAGGGRAHGPLQVEGEPVARVHQDVIDALAQALTERDKYTGEHSESVVQLSETVARSLGLDLQTIERVGTAALLHDIGKVAIPDSILHKPAKLDEAEWILMRQHPVIGERILKAIPGLGGVARIVRHEHERWDGGGYPDGLTHDAIPVGSRIILACDTYHAMTSDRPYRARMPHADALEELARCAGTQFDPRVTEALIGHLWAAQQAGVA
ncbi:MAG: diguanylate cyclase [Solirubrobacterales bacterium]|nr:diguanylate cyclase [Solirubrobacterales bacterium]